MEIKEITEAIDLASKGLKDGVEGAKTQATDALAEAKKALEALEAKATKEDITAIKDDLTAKVKELQDQHDALSTKMNKKTETTGKLKSFEQAFTEAYMEQKDTIKAIIANDGKQDGPLVFDLKEAVTIGDFNTIEAVGSESNYSLTQNTGIISPIRKRQLTYLQNVSTGSMAKPYAMWIEELDEQGTPIFIGEGDTKTFLSVRYEERQMVAKKIAVYGKVTTEFMDDLPQLMSYVQNNLMKRADIATETDLFSGPGTGDNLKGLDEYATAFTGSTMAGTITDANEFDVLIAAILQVKKAFGIPTGFFVNEGFLAKMISTKTTVGEYTNPTAFLGRDAQGYTTLQGVRLIGTNALDSLGIDFIGGDLSVINVLFRQGMRVQIGLDGNDFINNKKTILLEQRLVQFVSANDTQVLVKGDFATAKALLEATT
ncbi:MAG: phage major capsid protein [Pedobacter sp.]|jgi:HK97 family phage major capsid protein